MVEGMVRKHFHIKNICKARTTTSVDESDFSAIEKFVCTAYDPQNRYKCKDVNKLRFLIFSKSYENNVLTTMNNAYPFANANVILMINENLI